MASKGGLGLDWFGMYGRVIWGVWFVDICMKKMVEIDELIVFEIDVDFGVVVWIILIVDVCILAEKYNIVDIRILFDINNWFYF